MSTGNHGRAVAYAARAAGIRAAVCLSSLVPANKVEAVEALGADVRVIGRSQDEAGDEAKRLARDEGMVLVPPFDDPWIVAGQGTIGLELMEDMPRARLRGGAAFGRGTDRRHGAGAQGGQPRHPGRRRQHGAGAAMATSLAAGRPIDVEEIETLANSLGGGIGLDNRLTFRLGSN